MSLRDYFLLIIVMLPFYSAINAQGSSCANAEPFCAGDDTLIFPNSNRNIPGARPLLNQESITRVQQGMVQLVEEGGLIQFGII